MNILITGGTGGLGEAIVDAFATGSRNKIYFTYCHAETKARAITGRYANTSGIRCHFEDSASMEALLAEIENMDLDVLVNNAWAGKPDTIRFGQLTSEQIETTFRANVLPLVAVTQQALKTFRKKKGGKIITILTAALLGTPTIGYALYSSTKAYIAQLAKTWSTEYARFGITSNCVSPEFMRTDFTASTDERVIEQMEQSHPLKRLLEPQEVAQVVQFLATSSAQVNGVNIPVTAGTRI